MIISSVGWTPPAAPWLSAAGCVVPTEEIMMPSGMAEDSWYLVHDFSPSFLMKAFRRRERASGLIITILSGLSACTLAMNTFISALICLGNDWVAFRSTTFFTVFSKKILLSRSEKRSFTVIVQKVPFFGSSAL